MRAPTDSDEHELQEEDDEKEGKAYDDLIESLFCPQTEKE